MDTPMVLGIELNRFTLTPLRRPITSPVDVPDSAVKNKDLRGPDLPPARDVAFLRTILAVSSGTIASLTGIRDYEAIDEIQGQLVAYYLLHQDDYFASWMDVWAAFTMTIIDENVN